uniref:Uncharacterized protein n=1 Tax=Panagrolaimus sp. JU765 TaxID=591449 RepID=A0AC34R5H4_9BILA
MQSTSNKFISDENSEESTSRGKFYCSDIHLDENGKEQVVCICDQPNCNLKKDAEIIYYTQSLSLARAEAPGNGNNISRGICNIPSLGHKLKCLNQILEGKNPVCIGFKQGKNEQIGCYREPNLSHRIGKKRLEYGMNKHTWHSYLLCKSFDPKTETIRCFVIENLDDENPEKWQNKPQTMFK